MYSSTTPPWTASTRSSRATSPPRWSTPGDGSEPSSDRPGDQRLVARVGTEMALQQPHLGNRPLRAAVVRQLLGQGAVGRPVGSPPADGEVRAERAVLDGQPESPGGGGQPPGELGDLADVPLQPRPEDLGTARRPEPAGPGQPQ